MTDALDRETAIALCRMENEGRCLCEKHRGPVCRRYEAEVEGMADYLAGMRAAFAGGYPQT